MSHSFLLHSGGQEVTREQLQDLRPLDEAYCDLITTKTHYPVPHFNLLQQVEEALVDVGVDVTGERHGLWSPPDQGLDNSLRYFGQLTLGKMGTDGWAPAIVLRNSHDKAFSIQVNYGTDTLVCDNLLLTGILLAMHKHTSQAWAEFISRLYAGLGLKLVKEAEYMQLRMSHYEDQRVNEYEKDHLIMEACRRGVIAPSATAKVDDEYSSDEHRDKHGAYNVYSLLNAFTEVMKGRVAGNPTPSYKLTALMDDYAGVPLKEAA